MAIVKYDVSKGIASEELLIHFRSKSYFNYSMKLRESVILNLAHITTSVPTEFQNLPVLPVLLSTNYHTVVARNLVSKIDIPYIVRLTLLVICALRLPYDYRSRSYLHRMHSSQEPMTRKYQAVFACGLVSAIHVLAVLKLQVGCSSLSTSVYPLLALIPTLFRSFTQYLNLTMIICVR